MKLFFIYEKLFFIYQTARKWAGSISYNAILNATPIYSELTLRDMAKKVPTTPKKKSTKRSRSTPPPPQDSDDENNDRDNAGDDDSDDDDFEATQSPPRKKSAAGPSPKLASLLKKATGSSSVSLGQAKELKITKVDELAKKDFSPTPCGEQILAGQLCADRLEINGPNELLRQVYDELRLANGVAKDERPSILGIK